MAFVPSVIGETVASAGEILDNNGFGFSAAYTSVGATSGNDGTAKSQSPGAGTNQTLGTVVTVTFYDYSPPTTTTVPNVVGMTEDAAEGTLVSAGLAVTFTQTNSGATKLNHGTVKSQSPTAGSTVSFGTTITAEVYLFPNWFNLDGTLTSNDGTAAGANPGIWYYVQTKNDFNLNAQVSWSISGTALSGSEVITPSNQYLWAPPSAAHLPASYATTYTLTVTAQALSGGVLINPIETRTWQVTTPPVPVVAPSWVDKTLGPFYVGEAYSDAVSASGTSPTYTVSAGSLPAGITLSSGNVSGTPTTKGPYSFTITASNSAGSVSESFSGTVNPAKGGVYVLIDNVWVDSTVNTLNGSGGSAAAEVYYTLDGTTWIKSF